jgi:hypothetical protein
MTIYNTYAGYIYSDGPVSDAPAPDPRRKTYLLHDLFIFSFACTHARVERSAARQPTFGGSVGSLRRRWRRWDPSLSALSVLDGRIAEEVFAVYAVVEEGHVGCYPSGLVLVEHGAERVSEGLTGTNRMASGAESGGVGRSRVKLSSSPGRTRVWVELQSGSSWTHSTRVHLNQVTPTHPC